MSLFIVPLHIVIKGSLQIRLNWVLLKNYPSKQEGPSGIYVAITLKFRFVKESHIPDLTRIGLSIVKNLCQKLQSFNQKI